MQDIQEVFARIQESKKKMKDLKEAYKDALSTSEEYKHITDEMKTMRERKKVIENTIKESFSGEFTKIDDLKIDIASDMELLSDIALSKVLKGESVQIKDEHDQEFEPIFAVKFKKIK